MPIKSFGFFSLNAAAILRSEGKDGVLVCSTRSS